MFRLFPFRSQLAGAVLALLLAIAGRQAHGATLTWTGGAGDNNISTAGNWSPVQAPATGDLLIFAGSTGLAPQRSTALSVGSITFDNTASTFTLGGAGTYTVGASGITNNSTNTETINNAITLGAAQTWNATSGNLTFGGNINNNSLLLTIGGANNTTISGILSGNAGLTKNGTGTLTLSGANTYGGATAINAGVVNIQSNTALGATAGGVTVASGAQLQLQNGISVANAITISGSGISNDGALRNISGNNVVTGNITLRNVAGSNPYIGGDAGTLTLSGIISSGINGDVLSIVGSGIVEFAGTGNNNYVDTTEVMTGATLLLSKTGGRVAMINALIIDSGALVKYTALDPNQLSSVPVTINGGTLDLNNNSEAGVSALTFTGGSVTTGTGVLSAPATITTNPSSTTATISGNMAITANTTFNAASGTTASGMDLVISANISGPSDRAITKTGAGMLTFSGTNTYQGPTTISQGTLQFATEASLLKANWTAAKLTVASGATAAFNVGGTGEFTSADIDILKGLSGGFQSGSFLGFDTTNAAGGAFNYNSSIANPGGNTLGLTKLGTGTLNLGGSNTFTGNTNVNGGTLAANADGALGGTTKVTINTGGTLMLGATAGNNRINNAAEVVLNGGTFNTGGFSETVGKMTLSANSTLDLGAGTSHLTFAGASSLGSSTLTVLNWTGTGGVTGGTDQLLMSGSGFTAGTITSQVQFNIGGNLYPTKFFDVGGGNLELVPVPEPATIFGASALVLWLGWRERKRMVRLWQTLPARAGWGVIPSGKPWHKAGQYRQS